MQASMVSKFLIFILFLALIFPVGPDAKTQRSYSAKKEFRKENPCPSTNRKTGACPGFQIDHKKPLKNDGEDHKSNMQWLTVEDHKEKTKRER